jgi:hypothetical protein
MILLLVLGTSKRLFLSKSETRPDGKDKDKDSPKIQKTAAK